MKLLALVTIVTAVVAHGTHGAGSPKHPPEGVSWQSWHMQEEHQVDEFDPKTFFKIHDLRGTGKWNTKDILNVYGLARDDVVGDGSGMGSHDHGEEAVTPEDILKVVRKVLELVDSDKDGEISMEEWLAFAQNQELPDFGYGPGHHLDFELEYEEHHWNKYHRDQDPNVLVKHKEDIEHELLHHEHDIEETHGDHPDIRKVTSNFQSPIKLDKVPSKYRNSQ